MVNPVPTFGATITITKPEDMAKLLHSSSPESAAAFATAAHERACWGYDDGRVAFWERVVETLAREIAATEIAA